MLNRLFIAIFLTICCHLAQPKPYSDSATTDPDYSGCGDTYQCFGIPDGCPDKKNCVVLLKTKPSDSGADFDLYWKRDDSSTDRWVAAGLSDDDKMGNDTVTIVEVPKSGTVVVDQGYTYAGDKGYGVDFVNISGIDHLKVISDKGLLDCGWTRAEVTQVESETFNMKSNKYYILLAYGPLDDKGNIIKHTATSVSANAVWLEQSMATTTTPAATTGTAPPTSTEPPTTSGNSTTTEATTTSGNSTSTPTISPNSTTEAATTGHPGTTTPAPGSANTIALNFILTLFVALLTLIK